MSKTYIANGIADFFESAKAGKYDEILCEVPFFHEHTKGTGAKQIDIFEVLKNDWDARMVDNDEEGKIAQFVRNDCGTQFNLNYSIDDGTVSLGYLKERQNWGWV